MAKTFTAPFAQTPKTASAVATSAVASLTTDAPTNAVEIFTAGADGSIVTKLTAMPRATVTATALYLFISKNSDTTKRLIDSELMSAFSVTATTAIAETKFTNISETSAIRLAAGDKLYVGIGVALASGIVFHIEATDY